MNPVAQLRSFFSFANRLTAPAESLRLNAVRIATFKTSSIPMDDNRLFVGGLPWSVKDESLKEVFAKFGEVQEARVVLDRETGRSRGFGFVTFATVEAAEAAKAQMDNATLEGRTLRVGNAAPRRTGPSDDNAGGFSRPRSSSSSNYQRSEQRPYRPSRRPRFDNDA